MRRAALSPTALSLPPLPSATLTIVSGRQRVARNGMFAGSFRGRRRMLYQQLDGEVILADECKCRVEWPEELPEHWPVSFVIERRFDCPIDDHRRQLLDQELGASS